MPHPGDIPVSCLYMPNFLTSQPLNHKHFFVGMETGEIYIFDLNTMMFSSFCIAYSSLFPKRRNEGDEVTDIKCHLTKMHRLLISYKKTGVIVFSINKNRII